MRLALPVLIGFALPLTACVGGAGRSDLASEAPRFDIARVFVGVSSGEGRLKIAFRRTRDVHVESLGRLGEDGTILVDQVITEPGRKTTTRQWRLREVAPGRYQGSLSDAAGPVEGVVRGNCLELSFPMKGDLTARQWLFAMPDGRTIQNRMSIRKSGILVARLKEVITRRD